MEIEIKYIANSNEDIEKIFEDKKVLKYLEKDTLETIVISGFYYDTISEDLKENGFAFRIRKEGQNSIATLKWGESNEEGLYAREEINIPLDSDSSKDNINIDIFRECEIYDRLKKIVVERKIVPIIEIKFTRTQGRIELEDAIFILSVDQGKIYGKNGESQILEMEAEFYSGKLESMIEFTKYIKDKYQLELGLESKFERGLKLS